METTAPTAITAAAAAFQADPSPANALAAFEAGTVELIDVGPWVTRGMIVDAPAESIATTYWSVLRLSLDVPTSFTSCDEVAEEFAGLDDDLEAGQTSVLLHISGASGVRVAGDPDFDFECEYLLVGSFKVTDVEVTETGVVSVFARPA